MRAIFSIVISALIVIFGPSTAFAQSGYQTIQGTRVFTEVFQAQGYARFSNACGSQTLTQGQLQGGALPTDIIPCPSPDAARPPATAARYAADVPGSYSQTCESCALNGGVLRCRCRRIDQTYLSTAIDPSRCRSETVENIDGQLRCTYGPAGNADRGAPTPSAGPTQRRQTWGALAAGINEARRPNHVRIGDALNAHSLEEAQALALGACTTDDVPTQCRIVHTFSSGCGFITWGAGTAQNGLIGWGWGETAQAAYDRCTSRGITCRKPMGGCLN